MKAVIAHGGGPTAVLNASLAGVVDTCRERAAALYGARFGVEGILAGDMCDLLALSPETVHAVSNTPGSAIGSSRRVLAGPDYDRLVEILRQYAIRVLFFTGGNGSMHAALSISRAAREAQYELQVIGIPKTIDNDLLVTDHTPGYASTARFFACAARDAGVDNRSLRSPVCVLETLGRNTGWIVAATALARMDSEDAPHLIYFPERRLNIDRIAADVERVYGRLGRVVVAVCEGQLDEEGHPFGADVDRRLASNLGHTLARLITQKTGLRARSEKPGLVGRSCGPFACEPDRREAYECGRAAVLAAMAGASEVMVALRRDSSTFLAPLDTVAGHERALPVDWIAEDGNDVTDEFLMYARPLVGEIPGYGPMW